jgi:V/A-type H+/Na+-transporting ATPase subunit D
MTAPGMAVPPGRAGRLWVDRRLLAARRGAKLLDRKLSILQAELSAHREAAELTRREWERCCGDAERWLLRAALLGGQRSLRLAAGSGAAEVRISYTVTAGVRHPAHGTCAVPEPLTWAGPAAAEARRAHAAALAAAVAHATAAAALRLIEAEAAVTRYRLHAIRDRWIPRLEQARTEITFALDELERADQARLRRARGMTGPGPVAHRAS